MRLLLHVTAALGFLVSSLLATAPATAQAAPSSWGRWIDVDVGAHTATAMQGSTPVYTAPIAAGRPEFPTPLGTYYIQRRVLDETMDSSTIGIPRNSPGGYYLPHVMYTQYFNGGRALHGNYWAPDWVFGHANTSHGCVGMRNRDAAFFWNFASIGTPVVIHN